MDPRPLLLATAAGAFTVAGCSTLPADLRTPVPVRACVVQGGPWITSAGSSGAADEVSQMMEAVNAIWSGTDVAFIFLTDPRVIDDPQAPGMPLDVPPYVAEGKLGDIRLDDTHGYGSDEAQAVVERCNEAWETSTAEPQPGFTVVFVRELIWTYGGPTPHAGYSAALLTTYLGNETALCDRPYQVTKADLAGRWTIIETYDRNYGGAPPNLAAVVAHELGHDLLLGHGDGLDNDDSGRWDEYCDPGEVNAGSSLMDVSAFGVNITPLQVERAEASAEAMVLP